MHREPSSTIARANANAKTYVTLAELPTSVQGTTCIYRYKAMGMWGYESATRQLVMTVNDNFGGARTFNSTGWADGKVVFATAPSARQERFTFERQNPTQFKMTYEVSSDGKTWRMGDYVVFVKHE